MGWFVAYIVMGFYYASLAKQQDKEEGFPAEDYRPEIVLWPLFLGAEIYNKYARPKQPL